MSHRRSGGAFTLIELTVVMAILAILMGLVTGGTWLAWKRAKISACKAELEVLSGAITTLYQSCKRSSFYADYLATPSTNAGGILDKLVNLGYIDKSKLSGAAGTYAIKDTFGTPIRLDYSKFRYSDVSVGQKFDYITATSNGPDADPNTVDDIVKIIKFSSVIR